jgi:hypothetical protein
MIRMHAAPSPASSPAEKWPNDEKTETRAPGADNEKAPRIVVRGSPAFLTDRARGKWAAGWLPNGRRQLVPIVEGVRSGARPRCAAISAPQMPLAEDQNTATGLQALPTTST